MSGRLPFNAARSQAAREREDAAVQDSVYSIRRLAELVADAIEAGIPKSIRVRGEVRGLRERTHLYFDLADGDAVIACVIFASSARTLNAPLADGDEVVLTGRLDFYAKAGKLSLIATRAEPVGEGKLAEELRRRVAELTERGWLDPERKRPLPRLPRRIAVVTSRSSAAWQDVIETARRRAPYVELVLADAIVQGDAAAQQVSKRVSQISGRADALGIDAIIVTRGGGSMEDLWPFNDPVIAEAIVEADIPVVAAIGHETDTTITELVADMRASTPTQAAVLLTPDTQAVLEQLTRASQRLRRSAGRMLHARSGLRSKAAADLARTTIVARRAESLQRSSDRLARSAGDALQMRRHRLLTAIGRLTALHPARTAERRVQADALRLGLAIQRMRHAMSDRMTQASLRTIALERELSAVGPAAVFERGYTVTTTEDGSVIRTSTGLKPGQAILTRFRDRQLRSVIQTSQPDPTISTDSDPSADQLDLFHPDR
ncbi:MAG: exodeoxyribonuclease VII large subunit [Planctomycetota bacterium]